MQFSDLSIGARLTLGFCLKVLLVLLVGGFSLLEMNQIADLTQKLYEHPLTVGYNIREVKFLVLEMNNLLHHVDTKDTPGQLDAAERKLMEYEHLIEAKLDLVARQFLGDKTKMEELKTFFPHWKLLRAEKLRLIREKSPQYDEEEFDRRLAAFTADFADKVQYVIDFAGAKAVSFLRDAQAKQDESRHILIAVVVAVALVGLVLTWFFASSITTPLRRIVAAMLAIAKGDLGRDIDLQSRDEIGSLAASYRMIQESLRERTRIALAVAQGDYGQTSRLAGERDMLGKALNDMTTALRLAKIRSERADWIKTGLNDLSVALRGESEARPLAGKVLGLLVPYLNAQVATLYLLTEGGKLALYGSYAFSQRKRLAEAIEPGEGLAGQAFLEKDIISVTDIPEDYLRVNSSLGDSQPRNVLALPLMRGDEVVGVMELGSFEEFDDRKIELLLMASESLAVSFSSLRKQAQVRDLLERTQTQATQLREQQEELRTSNEELEEHTQALRRSEEGLKQQQEELQSLNEELEEKNSSLEQQRSLMTQQNSDLEKARLELERKAAELSVTSKYKSEFLANMSHELRTPLNSLLLLSRHLRDNASGRLSPEETESAGIIYKNGNDLLALINDILDLSKIESGKLAVHMETVHLADVAESLRMDFSRLAEEKGLEFLVEVDPELPVSMLTDTQRLEQILRNLVSNAVKFTEKGQVEVRVRRPEPDDDLGRGGLAPSQAVAFVVTDTGIGIPVEKHAEIFEAFQQVDGSTSRRYGGTGLGLSITRELARLLGGEVKLASQFGQGATFTVFLPLAGLAEPAPAETRPGKAAPFTATGPTGPAASPAPSEPAPLAPGIPDDRERLIDADKAILIIEDDLAFAKILLGLCHDKGFAALAAATGEEGLDLAEKHLPMAVILDVRLPGINGWTVLNTLKKNHRTQHIPVHVISVHDTPREALVLGAMGFLSKPVSREDLDVAFERIEAVVEKKVKDLLLVEDNADLRRGILELVGDLGVHVTEVETGGQALAALRERPFDCMILDIGLADMSGLDVLKQLEREGGDGVPPVIVYTGKDLTKDEEKELRKYAESIIIKGVRSEDRLLDEVTLFLHRMVSSLPRSKQRRIIDLHKRDAMLEGKKILAVDDDMRNLFAVSKVLEEKGLVVLKAEDGIKALEILNAEPDMDLVLLDVMMPVMDGYETLRRIRAQARFARLPVIALTAKAMKEDREKCIAAGASDYLSKPVDVDKMLSMMRVWLYGK